MTNINEYGEIVEEYSEYSGFSMVKAIALEDARKDLREPQVDNKQGSCYQMGNCYSIIIDGFDQSDNYAWIIYLIDKDGRIRERKIEHLEKIKDKRGCIIITACYDDRSPEVFLARQYRDNILSKSNYGQLVIEGYYCTVAPFLINLVKKVHIFRKLIRSLIVNPILTYITADTNRRFSLKKYLAFFVYVPCILILYFAGLYVRNKNYWRHR